MSNNINVVLDSASVQVIDQTNNVYRVNSPVGDVTLTANEASYQSYAIITGGSGTSFTLPSPTAVWVVYIKNLDPSATLTIRFQASGGILNLAANSPILPPGGVFMYWCPSEGAGGISALTVISSAGPTAAEVLLAA